MGWTIFFGALGTVLLWCSVVRHDSRGVSYGVMMLSSWAISVASMLTLDADAIPIPIISCDGVLALIVAVFLTSEADRRGWLILEMFGLEMLVHALAAGYGFWGKADHYVSLNIIYGAQVIIAGGPSALEIIHDWRRGRDHSSVIHSRSH